MRGIRPATRRRPARPAPPRPPRCRTPPGARSPTGRGSTVRPFGDGVAASPPTSTGALCRSPARSRRQVPGHTSAPPSRRLQLIGGGAPHRARRQLRPAGRRRLRLRRRRRAGTAKLASAMLDEGTATRDSPRSATSCSGSAPRSPPAPTSTWPGLAGTRSRPTSTPRWRSTPTSCSTRASPRPTSSGCSGSSSPPSSRSRPSRRCVAMRLVPGLTLGAGHPYGNPLTARHRRRGEEAHPRRHREVVDHLVQAQRGHPAGGGRHHPRRGEAEAGEGLLRLEEGGGAEEDHGAGTPAAPGFYLVEIAPGRSSRSSSWAPWRRLATTPRPSSRR